MAKTLKREIAAMSDNQLAATVRRSAQEIWLAGLGAFSTARSEGNKVFEALVKEGGAIQSRTQKAARAAMRVTTAKAADTRRRLEQLLKNSFDRSFSRFGVPTRKDVELLSKRLSALTALIDKLTAEVSQKR